MDTVTHTLFGLSLYGAINKDTFTKNERRAFLITAIGASQIPDIDVISRMWDTEGLYQMWHRGITHSIFLTPLWALLFYLMSWVLFKVQKKEIFFFAWIAVFIHNTSDLFNAWGTGYLEPFSNARITFGTIPIIDFTFWGIILIAFVASRKNKLKSFRFYRLAWLFIVLHVSIQSIQGYALYQQYEQDYDQIALSAEFIPWNFTIIGKKNETVQIYSDNLFRDKTLQYELYSSESSDLTRLFNNNPEAKTLYQWAPFVVIVDDNNTLGVYDPRFYRNGQSFLFEYIEQ